jgi:ParB family chromosome partitioning protein
MVKRLLLKFFAPTIRLTKLRFSVCKEAQNVEDEEYPESYLKLVEQLEKFFSQEISIKRAKNGGGKIVIGFTDDRDIEQFIERFAKRS